MQPPDPADAHRRLVEALLSDPRHQKAYLTEAWFHAAVDIIAEMLPLWVEGLYAESGDKEGKTEKMLEQVMAAPPTVSAADWAEIPVKAEEQPDDVFRSLSLTPEGQSAYVPLDAEPGSLTYVNGVWVRKTTP